MMKPYLIAVLLLGSYPLYAENIVFPEDSGVVDLTQPPYNVSGDGKTDVTAVINRALEENHARESILYLPNGTYLVSDTLLWGMGPHAGTWMKDTILQGQSEAGVVIKLKDRSPGFQDPAKPKHVIFTGKPPAQRFRNAVRNLTIDTGKNNPGASGILFYANNQGTIRNVTVRSGDGAGFAGIDFNLNENGPLLGRNLTVRGFDYGIYYGSSVNSVTLEHVALEDQRKAGIRNRSNILTVRGLRTKGQVPAAINESDGGVVTILDATLEGTGPAKGLAAIVNAGGPSSMYLRKIKTQGFARAVKNTDGPEPGVEAANIEEWVSHPPMRLFPSRATSLMLPVKETPEIPWDPLDQWVSPLQFGGNPEDGEDDSDAIQAAIDSGKTTVYLPRPNPKGVDGSKGLGWIIRKPIIIRGNVRRFIGTESVITIGSPLKDDPKAAAIVIEGGDQPVVLLERFRFGYGGRKCELFHQNTKRTLILSSISNGTYYRGNGGGDLFIDDVVFGRWHFTPGQNIWARQLNPENKDTKIFNRGANLWILGLKTESRGTIAETSEGGKTEIVGGHIYSNENVIEETMFTVDNSSFSAAGLGESAWKYPWGYGTVVTVKRGDEVRHLDEKGTLRRGNASALPLFVENPRGQSGSAPVAPEVNAEPRASEIELTIQNPQPKLTYRLERLEDNEAAPRVCGFTTGASLIDERLTPDTSYRYRVAASTEGGGEAASAVISVKTNKDRTAPTRVSGLKAQRITPRRIQLLWDAAEDNLTVTYYLIERQPVYSNGAVEVAGRFYYDTDVEAATHYNYLVFALDAAGNRSGPPQIKAATPATELEQETLHPELYVDSFKLFKRGPIIGGMEERSWARVPAIDFGGGRPWTKATWRYGAAVGGARINLVFDPEEIRVRENNGKKVKELIGGKIVASHIIQATGGFGEFKEFTEPVSLPDGEVHDVYITFDRADAKRGHAWFDFDGVTFQR